MPRFTDRTIDNIRSRVTISDVMQNYAFIENKENWESEKRSCPGIGKGPIINKDTIQELLDKGKENVPYVKMKKKKFF